MVIDIILCAIVIISAICYAKKGFVMSLISSFQWLISLALGFLFADDLKMIIAGSPVGLWFEDTLTEKFEDAATSQPAITSLPEIIQGYAEDAATDIAAEMASKVVSIVLSAASFFLIVFALKLTLFVVAHILSKRYVDGPIAWADGISGLWLGIVLGCLYSLLFITILVPVVTITDGGLSKALTESLESSLFSGYIYDHNPILFALGIDVA